MRDQIRFMQERINHVSKELEAREQTINQIEIEKRETNRKYEALDLSTFEL